MKSISMMTLGFVGIALVGCAGTPIDMGRSKDTKRAASIDAQVDTAKVEAAVSMPPEPTRTATFVDKKRNETVFSVGVQGKLLGSEAGGTTKVKFAMSWEATLTLVRSAAGENDQIVVKNDKGDTSLNYAEGIGFVGSCKFVASAVGSVGLVGTLKVFGNGVENTTDMERSLTTDAKSGLFAIKPDDNLAELQARCVQDKASVTEDLKALIANNAMLSGNTQSQSGEQKAILAAVHGPEAKAVGAYGHEWNVKPAKIEKDGDVLRVSGQLSMRKAIVADKQVYYTIEMSKGEVINAKYEGAEGDSDWEQAARKLADLIGTEAFIDRSEG